MRNPFTVFRRCRELEVQNEKLNYEIKRMGEKLSEITSMQADYPGIEPCRSQRCLKCEHAIIRRYYNGLWPVDELIGCARHAKCEDFSQRSQ